MIIASSYLYFIARKRKHTHKLIGLRIQWRWVQVLVEIGIFWKHTKGLAIVLITWLRPISATNIKNIVKKNFFSNMSLYLVIGQTPIHCNLYINLCSVQCFFHFIQRWAYCIYSMTKSDDFVKCLQMWSHWPYNYLDLTILYENNITRYYNKCLYQVKNLTFTWTVS